MKRILITYAIKEEFNPVYPEGLNIRYVITGVGKAKSAMKLTRVIMEYQPDFVINIGTAGTLSHQVNDLFLCNHFIDRDYQSTKLPGIEYEIKDTTQNNILLNHWLAEAEKTGVCNTGDTFVTEISAFQGNVIDMEAYAQALVCKEFQTPFLAVKYVTDIIGQNSVKHWEDKLKDAREALTQWIEEKLRNI
ncbi:MAG: nucleosidase [Bacteroides sp.]|nr:nucleosidase [Bacteroides sp.]